MSSSFVVNSISLENATVLRGGDCVSILTMWFIWKCMIKKINKCNRLKKVLPLAFIFTCVWPFNYNRPALSVHWLAPCCPVKSLIFAPVKRVVVVGECSWKIYFFCCSFLVYLSFLLPNYIAMFNGHPSCKNAVKLITSFECVLTGTCFITYYCIFQTVLYINATKKLH